MCFIQYVNSFRLLDLSNPYLDCGRHDILRNSDEISDRFHDSVPCLLDPHLRQLGAVELSEYDPDLLQPVLYLRIPYLDWFGDHNRVRLRLHLGHLLDHNNYGGHQRHPLLHHGARVHRHLDHHLLQQRNSQGNEASYQSANCRHHLHLHGHPQSHPTDWNWHHVHHYMHRGGRSVHHQLLHDHGIRDFHIPGECQWPYLWLLHALYGYFRIGEYSYGFLSVHDSVQGPDFFSECNSVGFLRY